MYKCPKCGIIKKYGMLEKVSRYLIYTDKDEPFGSTQDVTIYEGKVKRCLICDSKVKFIEDD